MKWRKISDGEIPNDGQPCLTKTKHGLIEGDYDANQGEFTGYYWWSLEWVADYWIPIEEVEPE